MNDTGSSRLSDIAAVQFMVLDVLANLLAFSEHPGQMGDYLTQQLRELVGARLVLLAQPSATPGATAAARGTRIVALEPARFRDSAKVQHLDELMSLCGPLEQAALWQPGRITPEVDRLLERMECQSLVACPLRVGSEFVGGLFAIDLLDLLRSSDLVRVLERLAPVVALVLRNSVFYDSLEARILERTQELARSEQHFRTLTQVLPVGIFHLDRNENMLFANARLWELLGLHEPLESRQDLAARIHPEDQERAETEWQQALMEHRTARTEFRILRPDGACIHVMGEAVAERGAMGELLGLIGTMTDITELRMGEDERRRLEDQLQQAQKMESIGRLAGGVAHDINNMLGVMMAHLELMEAKLPEDDPLRQHTAQMNKAALRSRDIIRQLLAFSRKQVIAPEILDINQRIEETRRTLAPLLGEDLELVFHPAASLRRIHFDPAQLDQILMNLAVNARDAMPGGGRILIETSNYYVDESQSRKHPGFPPGDYVLLSFRDEGIGMDPETLSHIFEPFFTTKEASKGTGLGLATVFGIVRQSGGFIEVTSQPSSGSTFRIYLPALSAFSETPEDAPEKPLSMGSGSVLLVEDDEVLRMVIPSMLEGLGYQVHLAAHPGHALDLCAQKDLDFHLMLTDIVMPGMNGKELWEHAKALRPGMGVVFMSGYTSDVIAQRGVLDEGVHFIQKPFSMVELGQKLAETLGK